MAKAIFKAKEFTVKAKGSKEFVSEEMVRANHRQVLMAL